MTYRNNEPRVKLHKPDLTLWDGPLATELYENPSSELLEEVRKFYDDMLVPELVCAPGKGIDKPHVSWIASEGKKLVIVRRAAVETKRKKKAAEPLLGCWILKGSGIYYPCINVMKGERGAIAIIRALLNRSFEEEGNSLWASTTNPLIQSWTNHIANNPEEGRPDDLPFARFHNNRVEWN